MTQFLFHDGGVWAFSPDPLLVTVTRFGCLPECVRVEQPMTEESARALLAATPGVPINSPEALRESDLAAAELGVGHTDGKFLAWGWD